MASAVAVAALTARLRLAANTTAAAKTGIAIKRLRESRLQYIQPTLDSDGTVQGSSVRAQIDEVFLVLALLGQALLPLDAYDDTYYPQALDEVKTAFACGGHDLMPAAFSELDAELQYAVSAGLCFCSTLAPMPVYRGFGAAVLSDWNWGCPDTEKLLKKIKARDSMFSGLVGRPEHPQPNRPVLLALDKVVQ